MPAERLVCSSSHALQHTVADKPNRMEVADLRSGGIIRATVTWDELWEQFRKIQSEDWGEE